MTVALTSHRPDGAATTPDDHVDASPSRGFYASTEMDHNDRDPAIIAAVRRAKRGDMDAVRFLYLRYKNNVYGYVLSIVRDPHEAEDVTQHVFLKLMSIIHKYESRRVPFTAWLIRVARNVAVDHQRRHRNVLCEEVYGPSAPADDASDERRWGLEHALETLPPDQREVVLMRHVVGLTPNEISRRMGRSEASVHGLHHRGRQALRHKLDHMGCAPRTRAVARRA
jgi:RNA polymerase sigma-70 factor, ECF subfamily